MLRGQRIDHFRRRRKNRNAVALDCLQSAVVQKRLAEMPAEAEKVHHHVLMVALEEAGGREAVFKINHQRDGAPGCPDRGRYNHRGRLQRPSPSGLH